jgi:simple sugar transport system ATP-binding protein
MENKSFLRVENISKRFGAVQALDKVSIEISKGEIHCLVGENGSGKSTLIKIISGVQAQDDGEIFIEDKSFRKIGAVEAVKEGIQVIYQDLALFPNFSVAENISLNQRLESRAKIVNWKAIRTIAEKELAEIGKKIDPDELVEDLSVSDKQIVAITRALTSGAKLIIMDEPTTALTKSEVESLFNIITGLKNKGISTLFVSHKLSEVFKISEKVTVLRDGKNVGTFDPEELDNDKLVFYMTGRKIETSRFECNMKTSGNGAKPVLEVRNLSKKGNYIDISFKLYPGEIVGVIGLLGSGRTEMASSIFGLIQPDSGQIFLEGKPVQIKSSQIAKKLGISLLPEDRLTEGLFITKDIESNIIVTTLGRFLNKFKLISFRGVKSETEELSKELNIKTPSLRLAATSLSGGNQQKVVVAKWISTNPKVFILDGPTVGIDVGSKRDIHMIIRGLAEHGVGVMIISDDIPEIIQNCNRVLVMRKGRIVKEFDASCISEEELSEMIMLGEATAEKSKV